MLAYVFWHRPRTAEGFEEALIAYHRALAEEAVEGFHGSSSYAVEGLTWLEGPAYEDWYLLEAGWALDSLGAAGAAGPLAEAHHRVASMTAAMTAGLYRLRDGEPATGAHATWLRRPEGLPGTLWRREMVLGPTPEFCLISDEPLEAEGAIHVTRRRVV